MFRIRTAHLPVALATVLVVFAACGDSIHGPDRATDATDPAAVSGVTAALSGFSSWSVALDLESALPGAHPNFNTPDAIEGCPFTSRDGKRFFIASNRPGGEGGIDIWISTRSKTDEPWGEPVNAGPGVNSDANDFCPTLARDGHTFYFVSNRDVEGSCGEGDIYVTRMRANGAFDEPMNLGCDLNSPDNEFSPFPMPNLPGGPVLYFSSQRPRPDGQGVGGDIYVSRSHGGVFGPATLVDGVNSLSDDGHPNVRRDGLEMYFYSQRADLPGVQGGPDIFHSTRETVFDAWSTPVALGPDINSSASETRPSLSWDGTRLYFGSDRAGSSDVYVTTRDN